MRKLINHCPGDCLVYNNKIEVLQVSSTVFQWPHAISSIMLKWCVIIELSCELKIIPGGLAGLKRAAVAFGATGMSYWFQQIGALSTTAVTGPCWLIEKSAIIPAYSRNFDIQSLKISRSG